MNAPNPSPADRDLEALRRAQRAHEPSMEEILASIRSIIADDRRAAPSAGAQAGAARQPARRSSIRTTRRSRGPARRSTSSRAAARRPSRRVASEPKVVWDKAGVAARRRRRSPTRQRRRRSTRTSRSLSPETDAAVTASFEAFRRSWRCRAPQIVEKPDPRNAAADAQELARRQSAEPRRAPGARRNPARRARRPLERARRVASPSASRALTPRRRRCLSPALAPRVRGFRSAPDTSSAARRGLSLLGDALAH